MKNTAPGIDYSAPRAAHILLPLLCALAFLFRFLCLFQFLRWIQRASIALAQILQPLHLRNLGFHLRDEHLELFLALLAGVGIDIAGVLFAVGPLGRVAPFKQMVVELGDAADAGLALAAHIGLEIGHTRRHICCRCSFLPDCRSALLRRCLADTAVNVRGSGGEIVWFSSSYFLDEMYNAYSSGANLDLAMNALSALIGERDAVSIRSKSLSYNYLTISESAAAMLKARMIGIIPAAFVLYGVFTVIDRMKKRHV